MAQRKKRKNNAETNTESILPCFSDDIIEHIFKFLPIKTAICAGAKSIRLSASWKQNLNLDFGKAMTRNVILRTDYISAIEKVLESHLGPKVRSFRLCFDPFEVQYKVYDWIKIVVSKDVEDLDLDFSESYGYFHFPSDYLLGCLSIVTLKLSGSTLIFSSTFTGLGSLKTLVLTNALINEKTIQTVLDNCLCLEVLELYKCQGLFDLNVYAQRLKRFKTFKVTKCDDISMVQIAAPSLSSIHFSNNVQSIAFLGYPPIRPQDIVFNFKGVKGFPNFVDLLMGISRVETLTINSMVLEGIKRQMLVFPHLKELQLLMEATSYCNPLDVALFLKNCPGLERLFIDLNWFTFNCGAYWQSWDLIPFQQLQYCFNHLKSIKVKGFKLNVSEFALLKFLLEKAPALESVALVTPKNQNLNISVEHIEMHVPWIRTWLRSPTARIFVFSSEPRCFLQPMHSKLG